jgi:hypothetical protein
VPALAVCAGDECSYVLDSKRRLFTCGNTHCDTVPHDAFVEYDSLTQRGILPMTLSAWDKQLVMVVSEPY